MPNGGEIPEGPYRLITGLLYGSGLRLMDARLRMKGIAFERMQIVVREGKGEKNRCVPLPQMIIPKLQAQMEFATRQHESDLNSGAGWVWLPYALADKFPNAGRTLAWQYIFPANSISRDSHAGLPLEGETVGDHVTHNDLTQLRRHLSNRFSAKKAYPRSNAKCDVDIPLFRPVI